MQEEIEDRYGNIPGAVSNLLEIALIKAMAHELYIILVSENNRLVTFKFMEAAPLDPTAIPELIALHKNKLKFVAGKEPSFKLNLADTPKKDLLSNIKSMLHELKKLKSDTL